MEGTKTVFITVYPTSPVSAAGGSLPEDSGPGKTVQHTLHPTRTIHVSPIGPPEETQPSISPYTTITVDIWGTGPGAEASFDAGADSGSPPISAANAPPPQGSPASPPAAYGDDTGAATAVADSNGPGGASSDGTVVITGSPAGTGAAVDQEAPPYGPVNTASATADAGAQGPGRLSTWHTVVTDTDVHWVTGTAGPSPVTILSEHTITGTGPSPSNGNPVTCLTTTGPDGRPMILEWPVGGPRGNAGQPVSTAAGVPNGGGAAAPQAVSIAGNPPAPQITSSNVGGAPASGQPRLITTTASFIALGFDGYATVIYSTWVITQDVPVTAASGALPTNVPGPAQAQNIPNGGGITTCTSYTVLGADGKPTVVESTLVLPGPASTQTGAPHPGPVQSGVSGPQGGVLTSATFTLLGANGLPTIVDTTFLMPGPVISPFPTDIPVEVITGAPYQQGNTGRDGITTCITHTAVGPDGRPTIVESTVVMPASKGLPTASNLGFPSAIPAQQTDLPQGIPPFGPAGGLVTTCITVDVMGPNGVATPVVETIVLTPATPTVTTLGYPSMAPQRPQADLPQGVPPFGQSGNAVTTCITVDVLGRDGVTTPVVQTIVLPPSATVIGLPTASPVVSTVGLPGPVVQGGPLDTLGSGAPTLGAYGAGVPDLQTGLPSSAAVPGGVPVVSAVPGFPLPAGGSFDANSAPGSGAGVLSANAYGWGSNDAQVYGPLSSPLVPQALGAAATLQTSTWINVIPEQTTTYSINFPMTTLATVTSRAPLPPGKRAIRRQESSSFATPSWINSTTESTLFPLPSSTPSTGDTGSTSAVCPSGGQVGNTTINFDNVKPGPLLNPSGDLWFSEGFLVAPPSSQPSQSYAPSSDGQLVEFVPPSLSTTGTGDTAEIGVGPNSANPCFRFDFFGAELGCAAQGSEQWCEFVVSAYTYNEGLSKEQSIAWSETKRVPACPNFPNGSCSLTPVEFEGYSNITSVLISLHVGLELRAWWGDDFRFGWTDNSCKAASCRARVTPHRVKRETVESALRRGVWHWTPAGLHRLDDEYIWESVY